jgi:hypothetical protein
MFSPSVSSPLIGNPGSGENAEYCCTSEWVLALKCSRSALREPARRIQQVAFAVVLAALIVEAVTDLVADDGANAAVVRGIVRLALKNGGCRMAAGNTISFNSGL